MLKIQHITREVLANLSMGIPIIRQLRVQRGRTLQRNFTANISLLLKQFEFYIQNISWDYLRDKTVMEIGPGDTIAHGLFFLAAGAKQYVAVDRFMGELDTPWCKKIYMEFLKKAPQQVKDGIKYLELQPVDYPWFDFLDNGEQQIRIIRQSIEDIDPGDVGKVDIIISFNVVEHLSDTQTAFQNMAHMLRPDGLMVHRVDYGPHGWNSYPNPLTFLTIQKSLWSLMGSNRGYPNRVRHFQILSQLENCGFQNVERVTGLFETKAIDTIRAFLLEELRDLSEEKLNVRDAEIVSVKKQVPEFRKNFYHTTTSIQN